MTKKELKRLSRAQLLELLIEQTRENMNLQEQLDDANARLEQRDIRIEQAGSIAQAALELNGVFEAAQSAAGQYIENLRRMTAEQEEICIRMREAERKAQEARAGELAAQADAAEPEQPEPKTKAKKRSFSLFKRHSKKKEEPAQAAADSQDKAEEAVQPSVAAEADTQAEVSPSAEPNSSTEPNT